MDFFKLKNKLLILLCIFVVLLPFFLITTTFASEGSEIEGNIINGFNIQGTSSGTLIEGSSKLIYFNIIPGKTYKIDFDNDNTLGSNRFIFQSSEVPDIGVRYNLLANINSGSSYTFTANEDYVSIFSISGNTNILNLIRVYEIPSAMNSTVDSLVENVGVDSIWNIFDISIDYIVVVVLFAFGVFLIFTVIRKISKGKGGV